MPPLLGMGVQQTAGSEDVMDGNAVLAIRALNEALTREELLRSRLEAVQAEMAAFEALKIEQEEIKKRQQILEREHKTQKKNQITLARETAAVAAASNGSLGDAMSTSNKHEVGRTLYAVFC